MRTITSIFLALWINFSIPPISEIKKFIKMASYLQVGFPFNYYEGENLTDEELNYWIKVIYMTCFIYLTLSFTLVPVIAQVLPSLVVSIERSVSIGSSFYYSRKVSTRFKERWKWSLGIDN